MQTDPPAKSASALHVEAVRLAVRQAFGPARILAIDSVPGGASGAFPFRVQLQDRRCLVRLEGEPSPLRNPHQYQSMRIASAQGIAPPLHHVDEAARVVVMDFIEEQPLATYPGGRHGLVAAVGEMLARVRTAPPFPRFVDYPDLVGRLWNWVCRTGLFAPGTLDPYTERFERLCETYAPDPTTFASSHNDPVPRNILFDGRRLWLVDWESAYRNDPLVDLAITLDNLAASPDLRRVLVGAAWRDRIDEEFDRRLDTVQGLTRLYYAGVLLSASFAAVGAIEDDDPGAPTIDALRRDVSEGRVVPDTPAMRHVMGKMYLAAFFTGVQPPPLDARLLMETAA